MDGIENFTNSSNIRLEFGKDEVIYKRSDIIAKFEKVFIELITEDGRNISEENLLRRFRREFVQSI